MKPVNAFGVPVDIKVQPTDLDEEKSKAVSKFDMKTDVAKQLIILGAVQIALGALSVVSEAVCFGLYLTSDVVSLFFVGYGFWIGAIFILTGIFGILAGNQRSRCHTLLFNIFSIISASFTVVLFSLSLTSAIMSGTGKHGEIVYPTTPPPGATTKRYSYYYYSEYQYFASRYPKTQIAAIVMESLMAVVAIVEAIVAIRSSLKVRKIPNSCCSCNCVGCCPKGQNSSPPAVVICRLGNCFFHCASYCCLPNNSALDQKLAMIGLGGPTPAYTTVEKQEEISTSDGSGQPARMDSVPPTFFYPLTSDQHLMVDDPMLQGQGISDHAKLIGV